jgi:hypothetical protein
MALCCVARGVGRQVVARTCAATMDCKMLNTLSAARLSLTVPSRAVEGEYRKGEGKPATWVPDGTGREREASAVQALERQAYQSTFSMGREKGRAGSSRKGGPQPCHTCHKRTDDEHLAGHDAQRIARDGVACRQGASGRGGKGERALGCARRMRNPMHAAGKCATSRALGLSSPSSWPRPVHAHLAKDSATWRGQHRRPQSVGLALTQVAASAMHRGAAGGALHRSRELGEAPPCPLPCARGWPTGA